ncbi:MAG: cytidyltransferase [Gammaproteobacteria bacterium]|nr:cytidyltransferase [Gammaproteobacteria bacterium]
MQVLGLILARGGSKGIPKKNLKKVGSRTLVSHSIYHALQSELINRVIVSTDDDEIAEEALIQGAEVPFLRPGDLATSETLDLPVVLHALNFLKSSESYVPDFIVHLRPTAPYRQKNWIDEAVKLLVDHPEAHSVRSVSHPSMHPYRMFDLDEDGYLHPLMAERHPEPYVLRRQDLPPVWFYNCVIDVTKPETLYKYSSMTGNKILPYMIPEDEVFDIDNQRDLEYAQFMLGDKI